MSKLFPNVLNHKKTKFWFIVITALAAAALCIGLMANPKSLPTFNGSSYRVKEILYQAPMYSFAYTLETAPQYCISSDYVLFSKQVNDEDWTMHNGLYPYKIKRHELYTLFNPFNTNVINEIQQAKFIYRTDTEDENGTFYLVFQLKNGDVLLALGYDRVGDPHIRWLFRLEKIGDSNGEAASR